MTNKILETLTLLLFITGCGTDYITTTEDINNSPIDNNITYSFSNDVMPILVRNCQECHGTVIQSGNLSITELDETYVTLLQNFTRSQNPYEYFIVPYDTNISLLYLKALGMKYHGGGIILDYNSSEAITVKEWILQGAQKY